mmetsp:Transcript_27393/g.71874  ORF Transcript_27393/g.71874 Transcript_27393/m.71874 type:complete len:307 (+) Transcript_27393:65-985(+)|eukprot:CAMPEP_0182922508 /NCGR_PEP_ID=MMETSP0105_2-20130417/4842_1 /TAXON_ID=81532 ORGANISM="Acanthoeca-like sp., Strain 10tr" /NCGR_SAMPLE_ID=MMETSP0105_2 /ASSEMBLY_ACC=CAM_ASM_000205 /LENGTH=306 /DNA_ID=CAMNT_0025060131 /DNA_START=18 /DNA_END=938 /DNA_ORIENTATION=+
MSAAAADVPPRYDEDSAVTNEIVVDDVHFHEAWSKDAAPEGYKFRLRLLSDQSITLWAENKGTRHQYANKLSVAELKALIGNPAISTSQFLDMLGCALEETAQKGELVPEVKRGCGSGQKAADGITVLVHFSAGRFMKQTFVVEMPAIDVDEVGILSAQMQDVLAWKRKNAAPAVVVGKWQATAATANGARMRWDNQAFATADAFTRENNNETLRLTQGGLFRIDVQCNVTSSASAAFHLCLYINGTDEKYAYASSGSNYQHSYHISDLFNLDAGATVQVAAGYGNSMQVGLKHNHLIIARVGDKI